MTYNKKKWEKRMSQRSDLSSSLVHLTKGRVINGQKLSAVDVLIKILLDQKIIGSDPNEAFIHGDKRAVCFQDAPLYSIAQNIAFEKQYRRENPDTRYRYSGCGLMFSKSHIYKKRGRPVIYDSPKEAKSYIKDENERWRIVALDLSDDNKIIDWTHEREWRVPGDLTFELRNVAVILDNKSSYKEFVSKCKEPDILENICGIIVLAGLDVALKN